MRHALRTLASTPVVSVVAVLSLALGIGANTAIFTIVDSLLLRPLPVRDPERLAIVTAGGGMRSWTNPIWEAIRDRPELFEGTFAASSQRFNLAAGGGETDPVDGVWTSGRMFEVLGVPAILGRTFTEEDDRRGGGADGPVVVIGYRFWQSRFGGAADAIGRTITVAGVPCTVVGVMPPGFHGPEVGRTADVYVPIGIEPLVRGAESALDQRSWWWLTIYVRLQPGQTAEAATAALRGVQPQIREATLPDWRPTDLPSYLGEPFGVTPAATGTSYLRMRYERPLLALMVVVALVLLIACANIANLLLARASARRHEVSVRLAVGASRWALARMLLTESLLLAGFGAVVGLLFAEWGSRLLVAQLSTQARTVFLDMPLDWRILGFTAAVAVGTALIFGVAPALGATRVQPSEALADEARSRIAGGRGRLAGALVAGQVALSLVLVVSAGLFVRTFASLATLELGFDRDPILVASVNVQRSGVDPAGRPALFARIRDEIAALPGVAAAATSAVTPVSGSIWTTLVEVDGGRPLTERERGTHMNLLSPGWFQAMGMRLLAGRDLDWRDTPGAPRVVVVNEAFVRHFLQPGENPIGRMVREPERPGVAAPPAEIVGVVSDAVYRSLRDPVPPTAYYALPQNPRPPGPGVSFVVRAAGSEPALLTRGLAAAIGRADPHAAITFELLSEQVNASLIQERLIATLAGFFGALALLLAGLGLYGVTAYSVSRRRRELAVRVALGAAPRRLIRLVLARVALLVSSGVVAGGLAAWWASQFVATLLFGLEPRDPATFAGAAVALATTAGLAAWIPARRAAYLDPARTLRES